MKTSLKAIIFVYTLSLLNPKTVLASDIATETENKCNLLNQSESVAKDVVGEENIAVAGITIPNLWWAREQFDPFDGKLINNWLARPNIKQIDLTVNWRLWSLLDYFGRYRFLNQFGTVARGYGYELRVLNQQKQCLGIYEYNPESNPPKWEITLDGLGTEGLQIQPSDN